MQCWGIIKSLREILRGIKDDLKEVDTKGLTMHILNADCLADAEHVRDEVRAAFPDMGEITISNLGVVIGALFACDFSPVATLDMIVNDGLVAAIADNAGIFLFLVILGVMVALVNATMR